MFDGRFRTTIERGVAPVGAGLQRAGVTADHLTAAGVVIAMGAAVAIGAGQLRLGLALLIAAALPDLLDGAVAKAAGTQSKRGAFFDSVADRVTDTLLLGGIAWYLDGQGGSGLGGKAALLPFAVLGTSALISYQRAKAESLGFTARGGLMERAERVVALCIGLAFSSILVPVLWLMLALTLFTAGQRFVRVWRQASVVKPPLHHVTRWPRRVGGDRAGLFGEWPAGAGARGSAATWREARRARRNRSWRRVTRP